MKSFTILNFQKFRVKVFATKWQLNTHIHECIYTCTYTIKEPRLILALLHWNALHSHTWSSMTLSMGHILEQYLHDLIFSKFLFPFQHWEPDPLIDKITLEFINNNKSIFRKYLQLKTWVKEGCLTSKPRFTHTEKSRPRGQWIKLA